MCLCNHRLCNPERDRPPAPPPSFRNKPDGPRCARRCSAMPDEDNTAFTDEADGLVACSPGPSTSDKAIYAEFRRHCGVSSAGDGLADSAMLLFKVTVDSNEPTKKAKPIFFVGVPQSAPFSTPLALCNRTFCGTKADQAAESHSGAFLLQGGYGVNPNKTAGNVFMAYGNEVSASASREQRRTAKSVAPRVRTWCPCAHTPTRFLVRRSSRSSSSTRRSTSLGSHLRHERVWTMLRERERGESCPPIVTRTLQLSLRLGRARFVSLVSEGCVTPGPPHHSNLSFFIILRSIAIGI